MLTIIMDGHGSFFGLSWSKSWDHADTHYSCDVFRCVTECCNCCWKKESHFWPWNWANNSTKSYVRPAHVDCGPTGPDRTTHCQNLGCKVKTVFFTARTLKLSITNHIGTQANTRPGCYVNVYDFFLTGSFTYYVRVWPNIYSSLMSISVLYVEYCRKAMRHPMQVGSKSSKCAEQRSQSNTTGVTWWSNV